MLFDGAHTGHLGESRTPLLRAMSLNTCSREEALKQFRPTAFFGAWDPAVLQVYVEAALYDDPKGGVRLKTPGMQVLRLSTTLSCHKL